MNSRTIIALVFVILLAASLTCAQQTKSDDKKTNGDSTPVQAGEDAGGYTIISSLEFGYRGKRIDGDQNKYRSDLNYTAGPRAFDSTFLMKAKEGKGGLFDTFLVTTTGWGGDPNGQLRVTAEKPFTSRYGLNLFSTLPRNTSFLMLA